APLDLRRRIFRKVSKDGWRERMAIMTQANGGDDQFDPLLVREQLLPAAFDISPHAQIIVDSNGQLAYVNEPARGLFNLTPSDLGRPVQDLEVSYRPLELRSLMSDSLDQRKPIVVRDVQWEAPAQQTRHYDVHIAAVNGGARPLGVSIS